jgi:hypothetical protein
MMVRMTEKRRPMMALTPLRRKRRRRVSIYSA